MPTPTDLVARLLALDTCAVSDALDSMDLPPAVSGLSRLATDTKIAGPIVTVRLGPDKPQSGHTRHLCTAAVEAAEPGDIIVVEHSSGIECAGWGGVLSAGAQVKGVAGVIIDGPARDIDEAHALGFPVFARSPIARTARNRVYEQDFNCDIKIRGLAVHPGDFALADRSGVVFIPQDQSAAVIERAKRITQREHLMVEALRNGEKITEVVGKDYETMLEKLS